jgi:arylsulfatase A-like enzyme
MRLFLPLALCATLAAGAAERPAKPNVLFFAVDDLRPEFGAYGAGYVHSPNLDRLARAGVTFQRAYCQQAVCSPSRTVVMTGTRPDTNKVWDLETHFRKALPGVVTVGQHFKQHGYFVQGMGKIFHGGFDDEPTWSVPWQTPRANGAYARPENVALTQRAPAAVAPGDRKAARKAAKGPRGPAFESADVPDNYYTDGRTADLAVETLRALGKKGGPFFLAVGFSKPHLPFVAPKKYWDLYDPAKITLAPNRFRPRGAPDYAILPGGELRSYHGIPEGPIPDDLSRQLKHGYYAAISYMDAQLGRVLDELERQGLRQNTIIVLWGDHGWKLGEHDAWCKHSNSENDTNAPLLLSAPWLGTAGARSRALVEFVDIYPTLADLAGLPLPGHLEGLSFKPVLERPDQPWKTAAFSQYPRSNGGRSLMGYSMRTDRHRFTVWVERGDLTKVEAIELYDHQADPQENQNLAAEAAQQPLVERLMTQWRAGWRGALPR